jgi:hypothetical protein
VTANDLAAWRDDVARMRARRDAGLRKPIGWLTLVGLHWLHDGVQPFGAAPANEIVLHAEAGDIPDLAGTFEVTGGRVVVHPARGAAVTSDGAPLAGGTELFDDEAEAPTMLELGSLRLVLIRRGSGHRLGIRVWDTAAPTLRAFDGLPSFDADPRWRLTGRMVPAPPGATIPVPDVLGDVNDEPTPGDVELTIDGSTHRLHALESDGGRVWLVFGDTTNGRETYGGGRFLVTGVVQPDGAVEVDFNAAYNPPCVFSPFATCPLPPDGNRLPLRIAAGEKVWHAHDR